MDFSSALEKLEETANEASGAPRGGHRGGGRGSGGPPQHHHNRVGDRRGDYSDDRRGGYSDDRRGGYSDDRRGGYSDDRRGYGDDRRGYHGGPSYRGGGGGGRDGYDSSNNPRRRARSDYDYGDHHQQRHQPRPRMGSGEYGSGGGGRGGFRSPSGARPRSGPLDEMHRSGYRVDPYRPPEKLPSDLGTRPFHLCLLAVIIDSLPFEHLWRHWAGNGCHVSLLVHAKYPERVQSKFVRQRLLTLPPRLGRGNSFADPEYLTHEPAWGSVQITRAMIDLLRIGHTIGTKSPSAPEEADPRFASKRFFFTPLKDGDKLVRADKFLFISETCVPVQTLAEFEKHLFGDAQLYHDIRQQQEENEHSKNNNNEDANEASEQDDSSSKKSTRPTTPWEMSWVNARSRSTPGTPKNKYELDQFSDIHRRVHGHYRYKADQWLCLSRPHATSLLEIDQYHQPPHRQLWSTSFASIAASDEMYFPSCLALLQILDGGNNNNNATTEAAGSDSTGGANSSSNGQVALRPVTYTDWSEGMRNPASFCKGAVDLERISKLARTQGSLVARKFTLRQHPEAPETGAITVDDWKRVMEACQQWQEEEAARKEKYEDGGKKDEVTNEGDETAAVNQEHADGNDSES